MKQTKMIVVITDNRVYSATEMNPVNNRGTNEAWTNSERNQRNRGTSINVIFISE